jgi:hypothetical protein
MKETIHKLKTKGLYVISIQSSSYRWCKLVSAKNNLPIRNYTAKPILKITDFLKLFDEYLGHLNWDTNAFTEEHGKAIKKMEKRIIENDLGKLKVI